MFINILEEAIKSRDAVLDRRRGYVTISIRAVAIFRKDPTEANGIWYDLGCAAQYLEMWPDRLAHNEGRLKGAGMALGGL